MLRKREAREGLYTIIRGKALQPLDTDKKWYIPGI